MKNLLAKRVKKNNKGFTLVELIIVIAIIAILVAVLAPNYVRYVDRSRWSSDRNDCESTLQEIRTAIVDTQNDSGKILEGTATQAEIVISDKTITNTDKLAKDLKDHLYASDHAWSDARIKHKNKQKLPGSDTEDKYPTYHIVVTDSGASGAWYTEAGAPAQVENNTKAAGTGK